MGFVLIVGIGACEFLFLLFVIHPSEFSFLLFVMGACEFLFLVFVIAACEFLFLLCLLHFKVASFYLPLSDSTNLECVLTLPSRGVCVGIVSLRFVLIRGFGAVFRSSF